MIIDIFTSSNFGVDNGLLKQERDPAHKVSSEIGEVFQTRSLPGLIEGGSYSRSHSSPQTSHFQGQNHVTVPLLAEFPYPAAAWHPAPMGLSSTCAEEWVSKSKGTAPSLPFVFFQNNLNAYLDFNSANLNSTTLAGQRLATLKEWSPALISGHLSSLMRQQGFPSTQVKFQRGLTDERQERGRMSASTTLSLF